MSFLSKLKAVFSKSAEEEKKPVEEPVKTCSEEPKLGLDEEMLNNGISFEPQNSEGGLDGLFNADGEDKRGEKAEEERKEEAMEPEAEPEEEKKEE